MTRLIECAIQHASLVRANPERVYDAFTTAEEMDRWFTSGAAIDAHQGGEIYFRWVDWGPDRISTEDRGVVLEARRPARFVFQWHPDGPGYATTVTLDFELVENGTVVRLHEHGFQDTPSGWQAFADCAAGWGEALTLLKFYVEHDLGY